VSSSSIVKQLSPWR